ncbi:hypothetical protein ACFL0V_05510, partial [Nanoarchaeota archaeon]
MVGYIYIDTPEKLASESKKWTSDLGIDLECENNLHHFGEYIAIIQISNGKEHWVVDVLVLDDIKPVIRMLESTKIQKIFHDCNFDLRILDKQFGCKPKNI